MAPTPTIESPVRWPRSAPAVLCPFRFRRPDTRVWAVEYGTVAADCRRFSTGHSVFVAEPLSRCVLYWLRTSDLGAKINRPACIVSANGATDGVGFEPTLGF